MSLPATVVLAAQAGSLRTFRIPKDSSSDQEETIKIEDESDSGPGEFAVQATSYYKHLGHHCG